MDKTTKFLISVFIFLMLIVPTFSFSAGLVPTCPATGCGWTEFMTLINEVIKFILFTLAIPVAAIMFTYAGFKMVTSGGSAEARSQAKNIFSSAVYGLVIAAGAWLIIRTILSILGYKGDWIGFPPIV